MLGSESASLVSDHSLSPSLLHPVHDLRPATSAEAELQVSALGDFFKELAETEAGIITSAKSLGGEICSSKFEGMHSLWTFTRHSEIAAAEEVVDKAVASLKELAGTKKERVDDDLARTQFADATELLVGQHLNKASTLAEWAKVKLAYLAMRPVVDTVNEAQLNLSLFEVFGKEKSGLTNVAVVSLKQLGNSIATRKYNSKCSVRLCEPRRVCRLHRLHL